MLDTTTGRKSCRLWASSVCDLMGTVETSLSLRIVSAFWAVLVVLEPFFIYSYFACDIFYLFRAYTRRAGSSPMSPSWSILSMMAPLSAMSLPIMLYLASGTMSPLPSFLKSSKLTLRLSADSISIISLTSSMVNSSLRQSSTKTRSSSVMALSLLMSMMPNALSISSSENVSLLMQYPVYLPLCSMFCCRGRHPSSSMWGCDCIAWHIDWCSSCFGSFDYLYSGCSGSLLSGAFIFIWQSSSFSCRWWEIEKPPNSDSSLTQLIQEMEMGNMPSILRLSIFSTNSNNIAHNNK